MTLRWLFPIAFQAILDDKEDEIKLTDVEAANDMLGGETAAWLRMRQWLDQGLGCYKDTFRDLQGSAP